MTTESSFDSWQWQDIFLLSGFQTGSGAHSASYSIGPESCCHLYPSSVETYSECSHISTHPNTLMTLCLIKYRATSAFNFTHTIIQCHRNHQTSGSRQSAQIFSSSHIHSSGKWHTVSGYSDLDILRQCNVLILLLSSGHFNPWRWGHYVAWECQDLITHWQCHIQKNWILSYATAKTFKLTKYNFVWNVTFNFLDSHISSSIHSRCVPRSGHVTWNMTFTFFVWFHCLLFSLKNVQFN